jgi:hypothetical protein
VPSVIPGEGCDLYNTRWVKGVEGSSTDIPRVTSGRQLSSRSILSSGSFGATYCLNLRGQRLSFYMLLLLFFDALLSFPWHKTAD